MKVIGIDMGGSGIKAGFYDSGTLLGRTRVPTLTDHGRAVIFSQIILAAKTLIDEYGPADAVGIVSSGDISPDGVILRAFNLPSLEGFNLREAMEQELGIPVKVENDAVGALVGELANYPGEKNVTGLTFGTGVGSASLIDGVMHHGGKYDYGHIVLIPGGEPCKCGQNGCSESYLSATALKRFASETYGRPIKTLDFFAACKRHDARAIKILDDYMMLLNMLLARICADIHPDMIILGGGMMGSTDLIGPRLKPIPARIVFARGGNQSGIRGAAIIASKELQK
ncbi:MAG: ROK family protein [Candidatus Enteromonas sp.]|nr:ROK family protein [Candidatus Enteromonas sp.]